MEQISLDKVLQQLEKVDRNGNPIAYPITFITNDLERNKGGERINTKASLCSPGGKRKAYHHRNDTRNLRVPFANHPIPVHPLLITHFNDQEVYL